MSEFTKVSAIEFLQMIKDGKKIESCSIKEILLRDETINRKIEVENCIFENIAFHNCTFEKEITFKNVTFSGKTTLNFDKEQTSHAGQTIYKENVHFLDCAFEDTLDAKSSIFERNVDFTKSVFFKRVSFPKTMFKGRTNFSNVKFKDTCRFEATNFEHIANFEGSIFEEKANFKKAYFFNTFIFRKVFFNKNVTFENATFIGFARFEDAECKGSFSLKKVSMEKKGYFHRMKLFGEGIFRAIEAKEALYFSWMECKGNLDFSGVEAQGPFYLQETTCEKDVMFKRSVFHHDLHLLESTFKGCVDLGQTVMHMRLNCTDSVFLKDVILYSCNPNIVLLKREQIDGKIASHNNGDYDKAKEVYVMLRRSFDYWGEHVNSEWAYYNFRKAELKAYKTSNPLKKIKKFFYWFFFDLGCGYGTKPINVTILAACVVSLFSAIFWIFGQQFIVDPSLHPDPSGGLSFAQAIYISCMNFVTMGTEGIAPAFDHWIKYLVAVEGFIGLFLMTVFVGTYTRKMVK